MNPTPWDPLVPSRAWGGLKDSDGPRRDRAANLHTKTLDFRGIRLKQELNRKGWNSQAHRGFLGDVESTNLSRDISREIGRMQRLAVARCVVHLSELVQLIPSGDR